MREIHRPRDRVILKKCTFLIMSEYSEVDHLTIVPMEEFQLFTQYDLISEIVRSGRGHDEDFLLLEHSSIIERSYFLCKSDVASRSTYFWKWYLYYIGYICVQYAI